MLATLATLHLLLLAQTHADPYAAPPPMLAADAPLPNPPLPGKPQRGEAPPPSPPPAEGRPAPELPPMEEPPPAPPAAAPPAAAPAAPAPPLAPYAGRQAYAAEPAAGRQLSLLGAEPLHGGSALLVEVGWSSLGAYYGQGLTRADDLGALATFDWATTELRLGGFYRRPLGTAGAFDMAGRLALAWYANFGKDWVYSDNHHDRGIEVVPALIFSMRGGGGIFSATGEAPITVTVKHDSGLLFSPRVSLGYEVPLYGAYTVGARAGVGYRAGSGDAPLRSGRGELTFMLVGGYRIF